MLCWQDSSPSDKSGGRFVERQAADKKTAVCLRRADFSMERLALGRFRRQGIELQIQPDLPLLAVCPVLPREDGRVVQPI
jgi:hypothetical protein